jgi:acyl-CoA thioester hydrolase
MFDFAPMFPQRHHVRIRYSETDGMGIVYHGNYLTFFEVGRNEFLRAMGIDYRSLEEAGVVAAVTAAHVSYAAAARFDDLLTICTRLGEMAKLRFRFEYEIWREEDRTLVASGYTEHALLDRISLRPARLPERVRESMARLEAAARSLKERFLQP